MVLKVRLSWGTVCLDKVWVDRDNTTKVLMCSKSFWVYLNLAHFFEADRVNLANGLFFKIFLGSMLAWKFGHGFLTGGDGELVGELYGEESGVPNGVLSGDPTGEFGKLTNGCCGFGILWIFKYVE